MRPSGWDRRPGSGGVPPEAERPGGRSKASATNRCPKQRFACTDGFRPVVFKIEHVFENARGGEEGDG